MSHFYFESFKKAEFRTYFLCSHKFSEKNENFKELTKRLGCQCLLKLLCQTVTGAKRGGEGETSSLSLSLPNPPPFFPSSLLPYWPHIPYPFSTLVIGCCCCCFFSFLFLF